jgi:oligopeptide transport system substrate-binding protein
MQLTRKGTTKPLLIFVCLVTLLLTGCDGSPGISKSATIFITGTPKALYDKQIYRTFIGQDITTLDPALVGDATSIQAIDMIFSGLVQIDDALNVQPELAQSWEQSSDGLIWTFHLHSDLTFSDGTPLTSRDVAYSIDRALQPATKSQYCLSYLSLLQDADKLRNGHITTIIGDSILIPDGDTVILKLVKKAAYFLYTLTYPCSYVIEQNLINKYGNEKFTEHLSEGGGAGPFIVSQYRHKQEIDFTPNLHYYDYYGKTPLLKKVVFFLFNLKSPTDIYQAYQNGEIDFSSVPPDQVQEARQHPNEYQELTNLFTVYIAMNFLAKPFDNLHIRQAFALSLNRDTFNQTLGNRAYPTYHIIPKGMTGYNSNLVGPANVQDLNGNSTLAGQLLQMGLQEEGWTDISQMPPVKITYVRSTKYDTLMALAIKMWQRALGVNVILDPVVDNATFLNEEYATRGNPQGLQMWLYSWSADYPDPEDWTTLQFDKDAVGNYMNYGQNDSADALQEQKVQQHLEQADAEANSAVRLRLYQMAEQQLVEQVAWIPLWQASSSIVQKPYVEGLRHNGIGRTPPGDWANIYILEH